jgi:hypothetical protein
VEVHVRILLQPGVNLWCGVRREVVQDDVDVLALVGCDSFLEEREEVLPVTAVPALSEYFAGADIERGEEVRHAVPLVVVGPLFRGVEPDWQQRLVSIQGVPKSNQC